MRNFEKEQKCFVELSQLTRWNLFFVSFVVLSDHDFKLNFVCFDCDRYIIITILKVGRYVFLKIFLARFKI